MKSKDTLCMTHACRWHGFKEELCKAMNLQAVADPVGGRRLMTNSLLRPQRYCSCFVIIIVFHPACSKESVDLIKHATQKLSSKLCDQIKAQQPYPQLHQGLIPYQTKLPFSFPLSLLKSPVIRSRLKVDDSSPRPPHLTLPHSRLGLLESPKPRPVYQHQGIRQHPRSPSNGGAHCVPQPSL